MPAGQGNAEFKASISMLRTGEIGGLPVLTARIHDADYRFILDSGASVNIVSLSLMRAEDLPDLGEASFNTIKGKMPGIRTQLDDINLGSEVLPTSNAIAVEFGYIRAMYGADVDGILRIPFRREKVVILDYPAQRVYERQSCSNADTSSMHEIPIELADSLPVTRLRLGNTTYKLLIDTGAVAALAMFSRFSQRVPQRESYPVIQGHELDGQVEYRFALLDKLNWAGLLVRHVPLTMVLSNNKELESHIDGLIGSTLLGEYAVCFDYANQRILLAAENSNTVIDGGFGMILQQHAENVTVVYVAENSPASEAGIKPQDLLVSVDRTPAVNVTQIWQYLHGLKKARFELQRGMQKLETELMRSYYLPVLHE